ncbi:hypothetical protein RUM43_002884 [Polyplax serrata]|uniref:Uncharacterized protein n=1 Tax=Polyplax serrata TaxID=468196 RepID=A0AAN8PMY3_POLSC
MTVGRILWAGLYAVEDRSLGGLIFKIPMTETNRNHLYDGPSQKINRKHTQRDRQKDMASVFPPQSFFTISEGTALILIFVSSHKNLNLRLENVENPKKKKKNCQVAERP